MIIDINKKELVALVTQYSILTYDKLLGAYGHYSDWDSRTTWDYFKLGRMSEDEIYQLYLKLKDAELNHKETYDLAHENREKEIREVEMILAVGLAKGCESQVEAATKEIERLKNLPLYS